VTSGWLLRSTESLVRRLKREPAYRLEQDYTTRELGQILRRRAGEARRGILLRRRLKATAGVVFAGSRVTVRHGDRIRAGRSLIVGDEAVLDALGHDGIMLGNNVTIGRGAVLVCTGVIARAGAGIRIGDRVGIGDHAFFSGQGGLAIGSDVLFGPGVRIFTENHRHDDLSVPIRLQGEERAPVTIEDDCWIGAGATILGGVTIGRGTVIGAASVVTHDIPAESVAVGVPCRVIRSRRTARVAETGATEP
jgi:acetyltransferase-like isoleucine patch superfamily enzyme